MCFHLCINVCHAKDVLEYLYPREGEWFDFGSQRDTEN